MYYDFVINIFVVLFLCCSVIWINLSLNIKYSHYILGVVFGLITIFVMNGQIMVGEGYFADLRLITMTMAGFIGGPDAHVPILVTKTLEKQRQSTQNIEDLFQLQDIDKTWLNTTKQQHREITTEDGRYLVADLSSFQMPSGEYACVAIVNDITDRKREQEMLRSANDRFSKAFQLGPHMMAILRKSDYRYVDVNRRYLEAKDFKYEDVIGKTPIEIGVLGNEFKEVIEALAEHGSVKNVECALVTNYGSKGTLILSAEKHTN